LNYELDTYLDALQHFPENCDVLQVAKGNAFLIKKDIFKNLMWYTLPDSNKQYPLSLERVRKIKSQNQQGIRPEELEPVDLSASKTLEKAEKKKKQQQRDKNMGPRNPGQRGQGQQGQGQQGQGNKGQQQGNNPNRQQGNQQRPQQRSQQNNPNRNQQGGQNQQRPQQPGRSGGPQNRNQQGGNNQQRPNQPNQGKDNKQ
jgi:hypothetical protein